MANHHLPPVSTRVRTIVATSHRGSADAARIGLDDDEPAVRQAALSGLLRLGLLDSALLERFLTDRHVSVRRRAVELAPRLSDGVQLTTTIVTMLGDQSQVAEVGAFALGEIGREKLEEAETLAIAVTALEVMVLEHDDALCRESAVAALGALHSGKPTILAALNDKATVRRRAVLALAPFDGPDIEAALENALTDRDWQVRQAAEDLLIDPDEPE